MISATRLSTSFVVALRTIAARHPDRAASSSDCIAIMPRPSSTVPKISRKIGTQTNENSTTVDPDRVRQELPARSDPSRRLAGNRVMLRSLYEGTYVQWIGATLAHTGRHQAVMDTYASIRLWTTRKFWTVRFRTRALEELTAGAGRNDCRTD